MSKIIKVNVDIEYQVPDKFNLNSKNIQLKGLNQTYLVCDDKGYISSDKVLNNCADINFILDEEGKIYE